jgi:hypothetical protein
VFDKRADGIYIRTHHAVKNKEDINFCVAQFHYFGTRYIRVHRESERGQSTCVPAMKFYDIHRQREREGGRWRQIHKGDGDRAPYTLNPKP